MRHFRRHERGRREPGHCPPRRRARPGPARPGPVRYGPVPGLGRGSGLPPGAAAGGCCLLLPLPSRQTGEGGAAARRLASAAALPASRPRPARPEFRLRFGSFPCETLSEGDDDTRAWVKRNLQSPAQPSRLLGHAVAAPSPPAALLGERDANPCETEGAGRGAPGTRVGPPRRPSCTVRAPCG